MGDFFKEDAMKVNPQVLEQLNAVLADALVAINQYFLHARMLKNWGLNAIGGHIYHQSIEEMKISDKLVQRIFLLEGLPNLQDLGKLHIGEDVAEILSSDIELELAKHATLVKAIAICEQQHDFVSRDLLVSLKDENEEHLDWLRTQQELIESMGLANYLQSQAA